METFRIVPPAPLLAPYIRHYWLLESDDVSQTQRIIPSGSTEWIFHRGCQMTKDDRLLPRTGLCGQSSSFSDLLPTGPVRMIAVVFRAFGTKAFWNIPASEFSNRVVSAEETDDRAFKSLEAELLDTPDDNRCIARIELFLLRRLQPLPEYTYRRMAAAVHAIDRQGGAVPVARLAETVCLSEKQFGRIFREHVGLPPKEFMRIVRFHKALSTLAPRPSPNFTELACTCGYYDQSHMIHEFKLFSGYTPREYATVCAPYSDYFL